VKQCQGKCTGTDRPVTDSPARVVQIAEHRRVVVCTCCEEALRYVTERDVQGDVLPALDPVVARDNVKLFHCDQCGYNYRLLKEVKARA
jgi:uncharacterized protein with PIN domain